MLHSVCCVLYANTTSSSFLPLLLLHPLLRYRTDLKTVRALRRDRRGKMSYDQFCQFCASWQYDAEDQAWNITSLGWLFNKLDENKNGLIEVVEVLRFAENEENVDKILSSSPGLRQLFNPGSFRTMFAKLDTNGDGFVDRTEFTAFCEHCVLKEALYREQKSFLRRVFRLMDADGGGSVTLEEMLRAPKENLRVRRVLQASDTLRILLNPLVVGPAFKEMDKDGDGEASLGEFLDFAKTLTKEVRRRRRRLYPLHSLITQPDYTPLHVA